MIIFTRKCVPRYCRRHALRLNCSELGLESEIHIIRPLCTFNCNLSGRIGHTSLVRHCPCVPMKDPGWRALVYSTSCETKTRASRIAPSEIYRNALQSARSREYGAACRGRISILQSHRPALVTAFELLRE